MNNLGPYVLAIVQTGARQCRPTGAQYLRRSLFAQVIGLCLCNWFNKILARILNLAISYSSL